MRINHVTGIVFALLGGIVLFGAAPNIPERDRTSAYILGGIFMLIGVWQFFARKGH